MPTTMATAPSTASVCAQAGRWPSRLAPWLSATCVTGAVATVPERFLSWLRPGGRLFVVRGVAPVRESLLVAAPGDAGGNHRTTSLFETELPYLAGAGPVSRFEL